MGRRQWSPLEHGGLEVLCELAFSGTEQLTKNVRVHVRTKTLGGRLPGCQHMLQGRKGTGGRLRWYPPPPQIARNTKNGEWALTRQNMVTTVTDTHAPSIVSSLLLVTLGK